MLIAVLATKKVTSPLRLMQTIDKKIGQTQMKQYREKPGAFCGSGKPMPVFRFHSGNGLSIPEKPDRGN